MGIAKEEGFNYNLLEAFDQPWKGVDEGSVGQYWGVFDANRKQKFELQGEVFSKTILVYADGRSSTYRGNTYILLGLEISE